MTEEVKEDQEVEQEAVEQQPQEGSQEETKEEPKDQMVPLSALQKERKKRQDLEMQYRIYLQSLNQGKKEDDEDEEELVTTKNLEDRYRDIARKQSEGSWIKQNPDRYQEVMEKLPHLLQRKKNLAYAIDAADNRYEEAYEMIEKFEKEHPKTKLLEKKQEDPSPKSPQTVSKSTGMTKAINIMEMSEKEYLQWRDSNRRKRR